ncbi:MAG TPA: Ig-like domain-containing protein, partial [Acidobacteriaceae bacterium]|nr:Ig-like domain-containing protein [Acidobacteriaceae bacterium]
MRAVLRSALFSTIAFTLSLLVASCGSISTPMANNTTGSTGTGPVPTVSGLAVEVNGVAPNRKQEVQFSEAMNPDTINAKTFLIMDAGGNQVTGAVTYDSDYNVASFQPTPALEDNTKYTAMITTGAQSVGGMSLAANYSYSFSTRADTDTSPLRVTNVSPFPDENCVSPTTAITITFNEAPDASTVTTSNIVVTDSTGNKIPVTLSTTISATDVVVTPKSALPSGSITVTVSGIGDLADQMMQQPFTWTFSTACNTGGGGGGNGGGNGSGTAYLYVDTNAANSTTTNIYGWSVMADGTLTPVSGSPFNGNTATFLGIAQNFLFGIEDVAGFSIGSWNIQSNGSLTAGPVSSTPPQGTGEEGPLGLSFDVSQKDLYTDFTNNGTYQSYSIGSTGSLSFINYVPVDESSSWLSFTTNNAFAVESDCYHGGPAIYVFRRNADGSLSNPTNQPFQPPQPAGAASDVTYCPWGAAALGNSNVIIAEQPTKTISPAGPYQMVNFTIGSDGSLSTTDTASAAPTVTVGVVRTYYFDPTQTWLAVAGDSGIQIFHWANGKLTSS